MTHQIVRNKKFEGMEIGKCLSCGTLQGMKGRRYCSIRCRQHLRQKLNTRNGLLQALNARYATFYFSDTIIFLDIIPRGFREIFRFTEQRSPAHKPAEDFSKMTNILGTAWWEEEKRTRKKYLASRFVLERATRYVVSLTALKPEILAVPTVKTASLNCLELDKSVLGSIDLHKIIKNAYRRQAKMHHPDSGGQAINFRKVHDAYRELLHWADNPTFIRRRGYPDKWFYDGENKRWVQPIPLHD